MVRDESNTVTGQESCIAKNAEQAAHLISEQARQLVSRLIEQRGHDRPPFSSIEIARLVGITRITKGDLGEVGALLLRSSDGYTIKINQRDALSRQNFSCAHEIGHILFSRLDLEHYVQTIEYRGRFDPMRERKARATVRERLCDIAATELLMPETIFRKYLNNLGNPVFSIGQLAKTFDVSILAAAIRIAQVSTEPCVMLKWEPYPKSNPNGLRFVWRIVQARGHKAGDYEPVHKLVNRRSSLYQAYSSGEIVRSTKSFKIDNTAKRFWMESKGFGYGKMRYVISFAQLPDNLSSSSDCR